MSHTRPTNILSNLALKFYALIIGTFMQPQTLILKVSSKSQEALGVYGAHMQIGWVMLRSLVMKKRSKGLDVGTFSYHGEEQSHT